MPRIRSESLWGYIFISPWLIGFVGLVAGPMLASLYLSLTNYDLKHADFVGAANYQRLYADPLFWKALFNTVLYTALAVPLGLTGSLLLAVLLNQELRLKGVWRACFYIPTLVPAVAASFLWGYVYNREYGLLNQVIGAAGIPKQGWLETTRWALPALVMMSLWTIGGGRMIIFLAGLQNIPTSLYEAAAIDGAGRWRQFWHVTLPMLSPVIFFNMILGAIGAFQVFTQAFLITKGGPDDATLFYALYLFRMAFEQFKFGYASALAWVLFVILAGLTALQFYLARHWVHYEGELK